MYKYLQYKSGAIVDKEEAYKGLVGFLNDNHVKGVLHMDLDWRKMLSDEQILTAHLLVEED